MAATVTARGTTWNTTAGNKTVVATPAVGDLIVVIAAATGGGPTAVTDTQSGTYVQVDINRTGFSTSGILNAWVRTALIPAASSTTWTATETSSTGGGLTVLSISGMTLTGAAAVRSSGGQSTGTAATTPAPVLSLTPLTTNPIITAIANGTSAATITPRAGYTEDTDLGYATPTTGLEVAHRASGETSATLTHGSTSSTAFASIALELQFDSAPTVALNAPTDTGTVTTLTPQLTFTGTDADSDAISYEVEVDTVNTFDSTPTVGSIVDSFTSSDSSTLFGKTDTNYKLAQSFTTTSAYSLAIVDFSIQAFGSPTDNLSVELRSGSVTGTLLNTSNTVPSSSVSTTQHWESFTFATPTALTNTTQYWLIIKRSGGLDSSNFFLAFFRGNTPHYTGGDRYDYTLSTTTWSAADTANDFIFRTYAATNGPLLDKLSNTDTGFTDITNGAHTDPFTSGEQIGYTTPTLTNGSTYYWRVRGKDPSGTNTYGAFATTQSFTVSTGSTVSSGATLMMMGI